MKKKLALLTYYFLGDNPRQYEWTKELAEKTENKIVQLPNLDKYIKSDDGFVDYPLYDLDPLDIVALIRNAEYVLTDSFNCTGFSNLFCKRFFTFRRYSDDGTASTNSRIYSILNTIGKKERNHILYSINKCIQRISPQKVGLYRTVLFC